MKKPNLLFLFLYSLIIILLIFIATIFLTKPLKENKTYYHIKVEQFENENNSLKKGQIVFIGDSITDFYDLKKFYDLKDETYNRGIGGDVTLGVLKRLDVSLYALKPKIVVLLIGINDINSGVKSSLIINRYQQIINQITKNLPNVKIYSLSILPVNVDITMYGVKDFNKTNRIIDEINKEIKRISDQFDQATYLDLNSLLKDEGGLIKEYAIDGLHLSEEGYMVWTNFLKPYLV